MTPPRKHPDAVRNLRLSVNVSREDRERIDALKASNPGLSNYDLVMAGVEGYEDAAKREKRGE